MTQRRRCASWRREWPPDAADDSFDSILTALAKELEYPNAGFVMDNKTNHDPADRPRLTFRQVVSAARLILRLLIRKGSRHSFLRYSQKFFREQSSSVLHAAVMNGSLRRTRRAIEEGVSPDHVAPDDSLRRTPMMAAAAAPLRLAGPRVFKMLLESGANPNAVDSCGRTALHYALQADRPDLVRVLVDYGADVNLTSEILKPIHVAAMYASARCIELLAAHGANVNEPVTSAAWRHAGRTPLHLAAGVFGSFERVEALLRLGANVNGVDDQETSPLLEAIRHKHPDCARLLLLNGADANLAATGGDYPIHFAAGWNDCETIRLLLGCSVSCNLAGREGATPVMRAARMGHVEASEVLFEAGADFGATDSHGRTVLMYAAESGKVPMVRFALMKGGLVDALSEDGTSALFFAAASGSLEAVRTLLDAGANPTIHDRSKRLAQAYIGERSRDLSKIEGLLYQAQKTWLTTKTTPREIEGPPPEGAF